MRAKTRPGPRRRRAAVGGWLGAFALVGLAACINYFPERPAFPGDAAVDCVAGDRRCVDNAAQVCTDGGFWSLPQNCSEATCLEGSCSVECGDTCTPGEARCAPEGLQRCDRGPDGCGAWSAPAPCADGEGCVEAACVSPGCEADCTPGSRRCVGPTAYTECTDDTCPRWSPAVDCPDEAGCQAGVCGADPACTDQCRPGELMCLGAQQFQRCQLQEGGCLDYSPAEACGPGQRCEPGEGCVPTCGDPECAVGEARCFQGGEQTCVQTPDGCVVWGAIIACDDGGQCRDGACRDACIAECVAGERRCVEGGVQTCERIDDCERWSGVIPCPEGEQCGGAGRCIACPFGAEETEPCGELCGNRTRRCVDGHWEDWGPCEAEGVCRPGEETEVGTCGECGWRTCNGECQWNDECARDAGVWERCNDCGWRFCCPDALWCECGGRGSEWCEGGVCNQDGFCE